MFKGRWDSESEVKTSFRKAEFKNQKNGIPVQWNSITYLVYLFLKYMFTSKDFKMPQLPIHTVCNSFSLLKFYCYLCLERPSRDTLKSCSSFRQQLCKLSSLLSLPAASEEQNSVGYKENCLFSALLGLVLRVLVFSVSSSPEKSKRVSEGSRE